MPFVTMLGGLELSHDVKRDKYDKEGNRIERDNGLQPLKLGCALECDFNPRSRAFKEIVWRGTPDKSKMMWVNGEMPVWRIPTNRFSHHDFLRLLEFFDMNQTQSMVQVYYEPHIDDIQISNFGGTKGFHFPLWVIEDLFADGHFDRALNEDKINMPGEKKLLQEDYDDLMKAIEIRREQEADEVAKLNEGQLEDLEVASETRKSKKKSKTRSGARSKRTEQDMEAAKEQAIEDRKSKVKGDKEVANVS